MKNQMYPCFWFDGEAKEAAEFYCSVFEQTHITDENPIVVTFESFGQKFMCLNGGPQFTINPSISFYVICKTEKEVGQAWKKLLEGGQVLMELNKYPWSDKYGWLQDKYGVSWQLSLGKMEDVGQKFTPSLMFTGKQAGNAGKAIDFYTSVFKQSSVLKELQVTPQKNPMWKVQLNMRSSV